MTKFQSTHHEFIQLKYTNFKEMFYIMSYPLDICHTEFFDENKPLLAYDENNDFKTWNEEVEKKLTELLGDMPDKVDLNIRVEWEKEHETFIEKRIVFASEKSIDVPCHLWVPKNAKKPCPAIICLQGHSTGMHISMGRAIYEDDQLTIAGGDRDFANQIVKKGYAALVLEQRAFGERKSEAQFKFNPTPTTCDHAALTAILIGRTLIGERVWDISRAIDVLETLSEIDSEKIGVMGNSGGGTATYYAACVDKRIKIAMPSCSVCSYKRSIAALRHCSCNYIPNIAKYFDMGELACLIAPRPLVVVAGQNDNGFFIDGVKDVYNTIEKIYEKKGAKDKCRLVVGNEGHRFYADDAWPQFDELCGWDK